VSPWRVAGQLYFYFLPVFYKVTEGLFSLCKVVDELVDPALSELVYLALSL
jgi:hypothetical protein